ncbi:DUF6193 family natural product biosynthesis protein [Streptomyces sp. NPDC059928]|uniref:DUF6193 family natural product biosynthesis protein n=1 Tax=unclassified Streptomyces TaxID=2593676 RepID=UPI00364E49A3
MAADEAGVDVVEAAWQELLGSDRVSAELIAAAYAEPRLRRLFPWVGMWELHFSRCTEFRPTWDVPYISPKGVGRDYSGSYFVEGPSRVQHVGEAASVREAVAMVVERLPANCGPAFIGSAVELAEWERKERRL